MASGVGQLNWGALFAAQPPAVPGSAKENPSPAKPSPESVLQAPVVPVGGSAGSHSGHQPSSEDRRRRRGGKRSGPSQRGRGGTRGGRGNKRQRTDSRGPSRSSSDTSRNQFQTTQTQLPGDSPEEIEAWIAARKARYPRLSAPPRQPTEPNSDFSAAASASAPSASVVEMEVPVERPNSIPPTPAETKEDSGVSDSDLPPEEGPSQEEANAEWIRQNALGPVETAKASEGRSKIPCRWYTSGQGNCRKGSRCAYLHDPERRQVNYERQFYSSDDGWSVRDHRQRNRGKGLYVPPPAQSLLKQLVLREIRSEHEQILQALEYFVSMNFFSQ